MSAPHAERTGMEFEPHELVHEFTHEEMDGDDLYDIRREAVEFGDTSIAARIDVEYRNALRYEEYYPAFESQTLISVLLLLGNVQYQHIARGNPRRAAIAERLADTIARKFQQWSEEMDVDLREALGLGVPESEDTIERDHGPGMDRAKHRDSEEVTSDVEMGELDEVLEEVSGPDEVEEQEVRRGPKDPETPDGPDGDGGDDPEGA